MRYGKIRIEDGFFVFTRHMMLNSLPCKDILWAYMRREGADKTGEKQLIINYLVIITRRQKRYKFDMTEQEFSSVNKEPFGCLKSHLVPLDTDGKNEQHVGVLNAWGSAILRGTPLVADGSEGINGLMLSNAMHLSSFLGRAVSLPIDEDLFYEELMKRVAVSRRKSTGADVFADTSGTY